jgi:hypothetical protein
MSLGLIFPPQQEHSMKSPDSGSEATSTFNLNNWMTDFHPEVKGLCLSQLSLPGAHNAGMDKEIT